MKKLIILAMVLGLLMSGCAYARIWQYEGSNIPTTKEEIEEALSQCEKTPEVEIAHKRANAWKVVQDSTVLIPWVGLGTGITAGSIATTYQKCLIECMKKAGYRYQKKMSNKARWDVLSDFDISEEEWINPRQLPKEYNNSVSASLSKEIAIKTHSFELPKEIAAFPGKWRGTWSGGGIDCILIVMEIDLKKAEIIYGNAEYITAKVILGDKPKIQFNRIYRGTSGYMGGRGWYTFEMQKNLKTLEGTAEWIQSISKVTLEKIE
jgi:hypothetical protein